MALQVAKEVKDNEAKKEVASTTPSGTIMLELGLYKRYNRKGTHYEAGVVYKFTREQALELLEERDTGRSIWRVHRKKELTEKPKVKVDSDGAVDMSARDLNGGTEGMPNADEDASKPKRIDIGDDSELEDLVNDEGDQTV